MTDLQILVVDVEATCWRGPTPPGQQNEIIEIGVCLLDVLTGERRDGAGILVRPERSEVSPFCTELTTLTPEMVSEGLPFATACALLEERYFAPTRIWASYGDYDRKQFAAQCASFGVSYPFGPCHLNVKRLFSAAFGLGRPVGMAGALRHLRIPLVGTHHRGVDDAWNIALILHHVLKRQYPDTPIDSEALERLSRPGSPDHVNP